MNVILVGLGVLLLGGVLAPLCGKRSGLVRSLGLSSNLFCSLISLWGAAQVLMTREVSSFSLKWSMPLGSFSLALDPLAAFFLIPLFLLSACSAVYGAEYLRRSEASRNLGLTWLCFNLLVAGMALVFLAQNAVLFLLAWELTALASFFLVLFEREQESARKAAWVYLVASHLGAAFIIVAFLVLGRNADSLDFQSFAAASYSAGAANAIFLFALAGFGAKAGLIPVHVWLPEAHPAAPSHVSALMSGVMIKTGIYGIIRVLFLLQVHMEWWGWILLLSGAVSGALGVLFALAQHDVKRLLAYSSVENIGIIMLGLGLGLLGLEHKQPLIATLAFSGALLHVLNHAVFKGLLFLGAGAVAHGTGTRELDELGGLSKSMPVTSGCFLAGSFAISGLPPLNGFVSEFLIYFGAFAALAANLAPLIVPALVVIGSLALIGGLATACFTKAFSVMFLGAGRSAYAESPHEAAGLMRVSMLVLAALCGVLSIFSPSLVEIFAGIVSGLPGLNETAAAHALALASGVLLRVLSAACLLAAAIILVSLFRRALLSRRKVSAGTTWDCGYARPSNSMQYTGSSFSQPLVSLFKPLLHTKVKVSGVEGLFPRRASLHTETPDFFHYHLFAPLFGRVQELFGRLRWIQRGVLQLYVLYIALTLLGLLLWELY